MSKCPKDGCSHQGPASKVGLVASGDEASVENANQFPSITSRHGCIGPTDRARSVLEEALKKARGLATLQVSRSKSSPPSNSTRAQKRLEVAEKEVVACIEKRDSLRAEMVSAKEARQVEGRGGLWGPLDRLRFVVSNSMQVDHDSEIRRLREQVVQLPQPL